LSSGKLYIWVGAAQAGRTVRKSPRSASKYCELKGTYIATSYTGKRKRFQRNLSFLPTTP